ncbi:class I SAM-dependent methyltransferase [candidate division WWE3 bacterium CG09_land_8_20_14_0_10_47_33]|uniref:Class I SAM-dependent methyltransferase n=1 Tax=candidate division WWE3 bacterium CG_4_9_14_0_2_um_filter_48_10 TaxID=1975078 RepID=A0A2M8EKG1_UNCKA|nr:MAG: class I SAM-dependent methyltransferase [candidate division WWE3 bacterium CG09_land_8_20_14_0_10_47_33]PIZ41085.1 MAG: class I SAM-dependent methyltransferase [candidate division WWE3 bacterium CG_4_10_14_0_2_um_filter_47_8]PJC23232.1 MAG: class I SAM-dependent methyltransferase [candidate division WWE3 bacterium CG_4_9_14_0_2_um_filter_48_10]PJE52128.1 MAG: SAM-dependent methyltransferase [candidate division WWE3 bacterium CG10_big_fil_rev_8_21_14_0_10_48_23]
MKTEEAAKLGKPSYLWRAGQERRLEMVRKYVPLEEKKILDVGCGIGTYLQAFKRFSGDLYGVEIDPQRAKEATLRLRSTPKDGQAGQEKISPHILVAPAEKLPFRAGMFDVVFSHEVLEHVEDDRKAVEETVRVLKPGGRLVIFAPNRLFPFETHGFYLGKKYIFGNIPLINYLPTFLRNRVAPHVKAYTVGDLKKLFEGLPVQFIVFTRIYPGFDKIFAQIPFLGGLLRQIFYCLEKTPLKIFGLSHFVVVEKTASPAPQS